MDLRVKKTQKNIKEAFFRLRKKKEIGKISVKELSELALINKATFYLHYRDIYDLEDKLENELISEMIGELREREVMSERFEARMISQVLSRSITEHKSEIDVLYSSEGKNRFINKLEDSLKEFIFTRLPYFRDTVENNILLSFVVQGTYYAHLRNSAANPELLKDVTSRLFVKIFEQ